MFKILKLMHFILNSCSSFGYRSQRNLFFRVVLRSGRHGIFWSWTPDPRQCWSLSETRRPLRKCLIFAVPPIKIRNEEHRHVQFLYGKYGDVYMCYKNHVKWRSLSHHAPPNPIQCCLEKERFRPGIRHARAVNIVWGPGAHDQHTKKSY